MYAKRSRVQDLVMELNRHRHLYYNEAAPEISDAEYDRLLDELTELENETGLIMAISPTQSVGAHVVNELSNVQHPIPLLSLDERKEEVFPHVINEDIVFSKDTYGKKHYYFRFYNEDGIELYTLKNAKEAYRTIYVNCEGFMLAFDQHHCLAEALERLKGFENGVKGEVERLFNMSLEDPLRWADIGFANILGRIDEARAHNEPIVEARRLEDEKRCAEREATRIEEETNLKEEYEKAIKDAEDGIHSRSKVMNSKIQGKSVIMQIFRKYEVSVPLKAQGWIINSLYDIYYNENQGYWSYHYTGNDSSVFFDYLPKLISSVQTGRQTEDAF